MIVISYKKLYYKKMKKKEILKNNKKIKHKQKKLKIWEKIKN